MPLASLKLDSCQRHVHQTCSAVLLLMCFPCFHHDSKYALVQKLQYSRNYSIQLLPVCHPTLAILTLLLKMYF